MITAHILESLMHSELLVGDLPQASQLDRAGLSLPTHFEALKVDQKLGHLYEDALAVILNESLRYDLIARGVQVIDSSGRTLGELDYILWDTSAECYIHLELAVKFYLAVKTADGWQYPGPDPRDNWQRKLDRMCSHQFVLTERSETKEHLKQHYAIEAIQVRQLIYGCLFEAVESGVRPLLHESFAANARLGQWLLISDWAKHFSGAQEVYLIPKPLWAVPISKALLNELDCISVAQLHALAEVRCVMFSFPDSERPYFLAPDAWFNQVQLP
jgi:hypothetical protein